jgi:hypothetical protein
MKVELLNKATNVATHDTIRTFLLHDFPKLVLAEFNTHRMFSRNWESSRARPVGSVIEQVMANPHIPLWTKNQKGMQGADLSKEAIDKATSDSLRMRDQVVTFVQGLIAIGVHKQDANRYLEPWMRVSGIVTATEWGNFYALRDHPAAQPDFQQFAAEMQRLDEGTAATPLELGQWYKPWPDLSLAANVCKAASISYANHAKDRTNEDYLRIHDDLINASPRHASPLEHCAIAVEPGMIIHKGTQVFDPIDARNSIWECNIDYTQISTANFAGFLQYRKILEAGLSVDVNTGAIT